MTRLGKGALVLATLLALTAGFVDAVGFLELGGFFLSFMSGNSTRLGVGVAAGDLSAIGRAAMLIALFVAGVTAAAMSPESLRFRRPLLLTAVAALLAGAAGLAHASPIIAAGLAAAAMGALNVVFQRDGDIAVGVTYMTGSLVRLGVKLAGALRGGAPWAFAPFLLLWSAMATGAIVGAVAHGWIGAHAFWIAGGVCAALAVAALSAELSIRPATDPG